MAEFPAFPLWTDAYLADTGHLTALEHGGYLLLLIAMWRAGGFLPNDEVKLAKCARMTPRQWAACRETLMGFMTVENERVTQGRLADELQKARTRSTKAAESARAKYRKIKERGPANAGDEHSSGDASTSTSTSITKDKKDSSLRSLGAKAPKASVGEELGKVLDEVHVQAITEFRKVIKSPLTPHTAKLLASKLGKTNDANASADFMMSKGWRGFEPEWMDNARQPRGSPVERVPQLADVFAMVGQQRAEDGRGTAIEGGSGFREALSDLRQQRKAGDGG